MEAAPACLFRVEHGAAFLRLSKKNQQAAHLFRGEQRRVPSSSNLPSQREHRSRHRPAPANKESAMQGQITKYRDDLGFGVIEADNGRRYRFAKHQIKNSAEMLVGQDVDFVLSASSPTDIIMLSGSPWAVFGGLGERE
jgi:cold shock CspA family protein